jgi:hypothetical protein
MVWRQPMLYLVGQSQPLLPTSLSCRLNIRTFSCRLYELMLKQETSEVGQAKHDLKRRLSFQQPHSSCSFALCRARSLEEYGSGTGAFSCFTLVMSKT